ncbi:MAG TPA: glycosyltransferase family 10 [Opitutaceae bacterium]|nr:glycosyltransferase family 10 [Opitutaceae bacterium]
MTLVRIVKSWTSPDLLRQTPGNAGVWGGCRFTLDPVERCDYLIALNHIPAEITVEVPRANIWCVVQEPPDPCFRWIEKGLPLYSRLMTQDPRLTGPKITRTHGSLPWHVGRTYDQLRAAPPPGKTGDLSWITSNLAVNAGHRRRLAFLARLKAGGVKFDLFGRGFQPIPDKWDGIAPYRYAIAVENHSAPHYWTEKIMDCFLAGTMPIYFGAPNIADYFPAESFVWLDIEDPDSPRRIAEIIRSDRAEKNRDALAEARRRVLEEHQFFPRMARLIQEDRRNESPAVPERLTLPMVPDLTDYYRRHSPLRRFWNGIVRRIRG